MDWIGFICGMWYSEIVWSGLVMRINENGSLRRVCMGKIKEVTVFGEDHQ